MKNIIHLQSIREFIHQFFVSKMFVVGCALGIVIIYILAPLFAHNHGLHGMFQTHDGQFHIIRAIHMYEQLENGIFPVRMVPDMAYGFGYLVFQFFYPAPYYATALFQWFGLSATDSWKLLLAVATVASAASFFAWVRISLTTVSAFVATFIFLLVPFRIATVYVTGQIGGYLSLVFVPLILWSLHKGIATRGIATRLPSSTQSLQCFFQTKVPYVLIVSISSALLVLSHALSVVIFIPLLSFYSIWLLYQTGKARFAHNALFLASSAALSFGLSAFYTLPFLFEKSWVKLGSQVLVEYQDHWPTVRQLLYSPWNYGFSGVGTEGELSFQIGIAILIAVFLAAILFIRKRNLLSAGLFSMFFAMVAVMLPVSSVLWEACIPLQLVQYPWRFLAATSIIGSWIAGWVISELHGKARIIVALILLSFAVINVRNYVAPWPLDWKTDADIIADKTTFFGSTDISWELMPVTVTQQPFYESKDRMWLEKSTQNDGKNGIQDGAENDSQKDTINLVIATWNLPVWEVSIDGKQVEKSTSDQGLITVPVDPSFSVEDFSRVELTLVRTRLQVIADSFTLASVAILFIGFFAWVVSQNYKKSDSTPIA